MPIATEYLKECYNGIIDRLDQLYTLALRHDLTAYEQAEIFELQERALILYTELAVRSRYSAPATA